ncbi:DUF805 domain-containing protein [Dysgonomonas sp. Marseille-P4677]|uniref:DUF805 domain-containing protein n=1 Tax=Dysgonomonas sp. Marseille-P4677 TaxID=2364790 RepID=UPI0019115A50|nr:DUF805 domain-containing protein [Dysgonomonas sp. Marseille-P4677]MBK5720561.1 DUF805 domain-containing protein [Dysgonomonas sp. Marseille-P4677]
MEWFLKVLKGHYADFNGRARRKEYWMYALVYGIIYIALYILAIILAFISGTLASIVFGLLVIFLLAVLVPTIAVGVRRMHDVGKSGWFLLVPIYNLILAITEGDRGDNQYGPDPKANEN